MLYDNIAIMAFDYLIVLYFYNFKFTYRTITPN